MGRIGGLGWWVGLMSWWVGLVNWVDGMGWRDVLDTNLGNLEKKIEKRTVEYAHRDSGVLCLFCERSELLFRGILLWAMLECCVALAEGLPVFFASGASLCGLTDLMGDELEAWVGESD